MVNTTKILYYLDFDDTGSVTDNDMDNTNQDQSEEEVIFEGF